MALLTSVKKKESSSFSLAGAPDLDLSVLLGDLGFDQPAET